MVQTRKRKEQHLTAGTRNMLFLCVTQDQINLILYASETRL